MTTENIQAMMTQAQSTSNVSSIGRSPTTAAIKEQPDIVENTEAFTFLRSLSELRELPSHALKTLARTVRFSNYAPGESITVEGDDQSLYGFIVVSGLVAMLKTSVNGKELIVELLQSNDSFDVLLNIADGTVPAQLSARSIRKTRLLMVPILAFDETLRSHPHLFRKLVGHLISCLQSSYRLARGLAHDRVEVRIAAVLSSLAMKFRDRSESTESTESYTLRFTRQQLADLTGTTPETAIRVTRAMQRDGIIDISRPGFIRVVKLDALNSIAEG